MNKGSIVQALYIPFPDDQADAISVVDAQGQGFIYINDRLSAEARLKALRHEELHFLLGHFEDPTKTVSQCEHEIHTLTDAEGTSE